MPQVTEYDAGNVGLNPTDMGSTAMANAGRRVGALLSEAGHEIGGGLKAIGQTVERYQSNREISQGAAEYAKTMAGLDQKWNQIAKNADPNNPAIAAEFREKEVEPVLEKLQESFGTSAGKGFAQSQTEKLRNHFFSKTAADMSTLAGVASRNNLLTLTNQLSNAAISDPSSVGTSLSLIEGSVNAIVDSNPNLSVGDAARIKAEVLQQSQASIVRAAAIGAIGINPEAGLKKFSSPEFSKYLSGAELQQLTQQAKSVQRAERADANYQRTIQNQAKEEASDAREGEYLQKLHSGDPKQAAEVSAKAIANDFTLSRTARERMIGIVERETKPEAASKVSSAEATDLIARIRAPDGDPRRITDLNPVYEAYEKGKLTKSDLKFVREEFTSMRTPEGERLGQDQKEFISSVKPLIDKSNPLMGKIDQSGPQNVYRLTLDLQRKVAEYRKAGKDPRDLMDPSKPDYMGSPAALAPYQKTLQTSLGDAADALRRGNIVSPPRNDVMPAVPPPDQRPPGLYETPKGKKQWTGTGWVNP